MSDTERKIVELRYLEVKKHTWKEIGNIVGYISDYCRKEIINSLMYTFLHRLNYGIINYKYILKRRG
ncbi:hypothetical protein ACSXEP_02385 [Clostridium perfringens]